MPTRAKIPTLKVPNYPDLDLFVLAARGAWIEHHKKRSIGHPTSRIQIWEVLSKGRAEKYINLSTSLYKLVDFVKKELGTYPHEDTVRKYAKAWRVAVSQAVPHADQVAWIRKHVPDAGAAIEELENGALNAFVLLFTTLRNDSRLAGQLGAISPLIRAAQARLPRIALILGSQKEKQLQKCIQAVQPSSR